MEITEEKILQLGFVKSKSIIDYYIKGDKCVYFEHGIWFAGFQLSHGLMEVMNMEQLVLEIKNPYIK